ncbi:MAG: RNA-guided endonuclease IscB [Candidatus Shapirobacteria bacterium]
MQKLQAKLKNVPRNAPQVPCSTSNQLNKEETLSVDNKVLTCNNLEVDQRSHTTGLKAVVYVLSMLGNPLMPCTQTKARKLLKSKKAKIFKMYPFTIKLCFECENKVQDVTFGIDTGYQNIGFSAITDKKELASGELILDWKTSKKLATRKMYRKYKRNKLWHRKARWKNRVSTKKKGWLPPSIQRRYDTHLNLLNKYKAILPITKVIVETAKFDIQKINNPEIQGIEYRQGPMYEYRNMRSYLMARENGMCQICHKKFEHGNPSHIHHKLQRSESGSNKASNLAIVHKKCHDDFHAKGLKMSAPKSMKAETFMSIVHNRFIKDIPNVQITYGYKTFVDRNELNLEKTHCNDAFVIAKGCFQLRTKPIIITQKHRNNRSLQCNRKGFDPAIRRKRYKIQPKDLVWIDNKKYTASGTHSKGKAVDIKDGKSIGIKKIEKVYHFGSFTFN